MTIQYKSATFDLTSTNATTVLSISTSAIAIVRTVQAVHDTASNVNAHLILKKSGGSDVKIGYKQVNLDTESMLTGPLNLEAGDAIKAQAETANKLEVVVSYALINRENENG